MNEDNHRFFGIDVLMVYSLIFPLRKNKKTAGKKQYIKLYISNLVFPVKIIIDYSAQCKLYSVKCKM